MLCRLALCRRSGRAGVKDPKRPGDVPGSAVSQIDDYSPPCTRFGPPDQAAGASPGGGSDGARRASAKPLARACDPAKDIAVRATCTRRPFKIDRAMLPGTAAGAHPGLSRGRGRGAGSTERLRWCGSPCPGNKGNRSGASGGCSKHERFNMRQHAGRQGARRQAQGGRPRAAGARRDANAMTVRDARDGLHATVRRTINVRDATGRGREAAHGARRAAPRG